MNQQQVAIVVKLIRELGKALEAASTYKGKLTTEVREVLETAIGMFESTLADILNPDGTLTADLIRRAVFEISEITWSIDFNLHGCDIESDNSDHHFRTALMMVKTAKELQDEYSYCAPPPIMKVMTVSLPCRAHSGLHAGIARWARSMLREFPISPPDPSRERARGGS